MLVGWSGSTVNFFEQHLKFKSYEKRKIVFEELYICMIWTDSKQISQSIKNF